jgi:membrane protease YdiL (CAAX protease family)
MSTKSLRRSAATKPSAAAMKRSGKRRPPKTQSRRARTKSQAMSEHYWDVTHRPLQCLVFLLPMILAYEVGMILLHGGRGNDPPSALAAQQLLQWFFSLFGANGFYLPGLALIVVLLGWQMASSFPWKVYVQPLLGMAGESVLLAVPLLLMNQWLPLLRSLQGSTAQPATLREGVDELLLSVGAGLYEELVFRLIIISLLTLLLIDIGRLRQVTGVALAVIVSSALFAAHHYHPIGADAWSTGEFAFRVVAGGYLAVVYVTRGFGLAVGCHVTYDVMAFLL